MRATLRADTASDTADLAHVHNVLALALRRARDVHGRGRGDTVNNALGASCDTSAAGYASVGVDLRKSAVDRNRVFGADGFTVAAAEASVAARLVAAVKRRVRSTSGVALVFELISAVFNSALAVNHRNGRLLVLQFDAEKLCYFGFLFGRGDVTVGKFRATRSELGSKSAATRAAAAAAVRARKIIHDFGNLFVDVDLEHLAYNEYQ